MTDKELLTEARSIVSRWKETDIFNGIEVRKDNRRKMVALCDLKNRRILINTKHEHIRNKNAIRLIVLHELGHFYHKDNDTDNCEYLAHKFALDTIKTFYAESYSHAINALKTTIEYMEQENQQETYKEHYEAYKRIYEEIQEKETEKAP